MLFFNTLFSENYPTPISRHRAEFQGGFVRGGITPIFVGDAKPPNEALAGSWRGSLTGVFAIGCNAFYAFNIEVLVDVERHIPSGRCHLKQHRSRLVRDLPTINPAFECTRRVFITSRGHLALNSDRAKEVDCWNAISSIFHISGLPHNVTIRKSLNVSNDVTRFV